MRAHILPSLALAALAGACGGAAKSDAPEKPRGVPVRTAQVERRELADTLLLTGTLRPQAQVQIVAEVGARLLRVLKDEGSRVAAGETLAVLDETDYRLSHDRAKAALAVAEANKAHAVAEKERAAGLLKTGGITDKENLSAQVGLQVAEASLAQARAEAAIAGTQQARAQVKAPFAGRVAKRHVDAGAMLSAGTPLFTLVDDSRLEFRASVPSADYGKVKLGDPVDVSVDAGGRTVKGTVARVSPLIEERTRSFEVVVQVPGEKDLVGGLFARAVVRVGRVADALVVPPSALVRDGSDPLSAQTFVVAGGKAERRKVTVGVETADAIQVREGLKAGDVVVLDPPVALGSGAPVEVQEMILTRVSIKQPVFATMMMAGLAVLGLTSYRQLNVDQFPDVEFPIVTVTTVYPGASPEAVERDVTRRIEEAVNTVEGIRTVESTSQEGLSNIVIMFHVETSTQVASQDIRGKVASIRGQLPREIEEPIVQRIDPNALPIISVAVDAPGLSPQAATQLADKTIKKRLETVAGVGAVNLVGESTREIQVVVDRARLEAYHVSLSQVVDALRTENVDLPAGSTDRGATEALVRVAARGRSAADIARIPVKQADATTIFVSDVAQVVDGVEQPKNLAMLDTTPALALDVLKQSGANTVEVADGVGAMVGRMAGELPPGVSLQVVRDDSTFIRDSIHDVNLTMVIGGILTVLIVFAFLNSWRSTVITGLTLPISVIAAFTVMKVFGFTLNVMTLMGLSLAIGMLIDDAIVVRENIVRHLQRGKGHVEASMDGTSEIGLAVMATTFTIVAVFIPVAFMGGMVGKFFYEFGITVAAAVLVSLFVSFTLDPMLSSRWVDPDIEEDRHEGVIGKALARFNHWFDDLHVKYERVLAWSLRHRLAVLGIAAVAFLGSFPILGLLGGDFMPDFNRGEYQIAFRATPGATLRETGERARAMVEVLKKIPDVEYTYTTIGEAGTTYRPVTEGTTYVKLKPGSGKTFSQVLSEARTAILTVPGLTYGLFEAGPFGQKPIQISVRGASVDELDRISRELMQAMSQIKGVADIETSLEKSKPELRLRLDRGRASDLGVPAGVIGTTMGAAVAGQVATVIEDAEGESHDVRVRLKADQRRYASDLLELTVPTDEDDANGDKLLVPLREMASAEVGTGPSTIRRKNLVREVRVSANPDGRSLGEISADINTVQDALKLPPGYDFVRGGDEEELAIMFENMMQALFLAVVFIYLILASQFGSFTQPFAIMLSLPLSLVGVAVALLLTRDTLNIMSMIGLIMLMGLVTKNAILLVDFANQARGEGLGRDEALIKAGSTRLRPIVMTTLAMIFGMLPLAFAIGAGAEMRAPMARAVIGGLITSTLLTLVVVPVVYTYLDGLRPGSILEWLGAQRARWRRRREGAVYPVRTAGSLPAKD